MDDYIIDPDLFYENIRKALDNFQVEYIYIRLKGSGGGRVLISEDLNCKTLDILHRDNGLAVIINDDERFFYEIIADWERKFTLVHFRGYGIRPPAGVNPDDEKLPPVKESILRGANHIHLIEITFEGKIPLRISSPKNKDRAWDLWEIDV